MRMLFKITLCLLFFCCASTGNAQIFKKLKDSVQNAAERTVLRKAEEKTEKATEEAIENAMSKEENDKQSSEEPSKAENDAMASGLMDAIMGGGDVTTKDVYSFHTTVDIYVEDHSSKKVEEGNMTNYYGDGVMSTVTGEEGTYVIDMENDAAIIIDEKEKIARTMSMSWMKKMLAGQSKNAPDLDEEEGSFRKTGRTKTVSGYACEEYEYLNEREKERSEIWMTKEVDFDMERFGEDVGNLFGQSFNTTAFQDTYGFMMEATHYEKDKKVSFYQVQKVEKKQIVLNMEDYTVTSMLGQ